MRNGQCQEQLLADIREKIKYLHRSDFELSDVFLGKRDITGILNLGKIKQIPVDRETNRLILTLSRCLLEQTFSDQRSRFTDSDWHAIVRETLGDAIYDEIIGEAGAEETARDVLLKIKNAIRKIIDQIQERTFVFGCHFSKTEDFAPLSIGPVCFEPKAIWLSRIQSKGMISKITLSRIERSWRDKRLRKRKKFKDAWLERGLLETIGDGGYVCSVSVGRAGSEAGLYKALTAARLALAAVAMCFRSPSRVLRDMVLIRDVGRLKKQHIEFSSNEEFSWKMCLSYMSGGTDFLTEQEGKQLSKDFSREFATAGKAIRVFTHGDTAVDQPKLMQALFQSLLWFYEAEKEDLDPVAIAKFCASMEALSGGGRETGIRQLIQSHFPHWNDEELRDTVRRLYSKVRGRTLHGTNTQLGYDWKNDRALAEYFASLCLLGSLRKVSQTNEDTKDTRAFFLS